MSIARPSRILLVTGMSGAGKSTALKALEDSGWETVDNLPLSLLNRLIDTQPSEGAPDGRPLAIGIDSRTRGFDGAAIVEHIKAMRIRGDDIETLFLDCGGTELDRRYSETRRRHPLALDRPATDGLSREREILAPVRRWADQIIDTTTIGSNALRQAMRERFGSIEGKALVLSVMSFGFARGLPRNADMVFDVRFLQNPHWDKALRPLSGLDAPVAAYIAQDPAYHDAITRIEDLLITLLPRYEAEGKSYVTIAFGCTGGRHRSVHIADRVSQRLRNAGFSPTVSHRDLASRPDDSTEGAPRNSRQLD